MNALHSWLGSGNKESVSIRELGMRLSPDQRGKIKTKLASLEARAPALAQTNLAFFKFGDEIKAHLSIISVAHNFRSLKTGTDPLLLYEELERDIDSQLLSWKKTRFKQNKEGSVPLQALFNNGQNKEVASYEN